LGVSVLWEVGLPHARAAAGMGDGDPRRCALLAPCRPVRVAVASTLSPSSKPARYCR